ncbi:MAG: hypothetical protein AAGD43_03105 [Pseudomonadota bacterium]
MYTGRLYFLSLSWEPLELYSCAKARPRNVIDARGYADFDPLGQSVRVLREEEKGHDRLAHQVP